MKSLASKVVAAIELNDAFADIVCGIWRCY